MRERRESYRLAVHGVDGLIETPRGRVVEVALADLSAGGSSLVLPSDVGAGLSTLILRAAGHPTLRVGVSPVRTLALPHQRSLAGVRFDAPDADALRMLSRLLVERFDAGPAGLPPTESASIGDFQRQRVHQVLQFHVIANGQPVHVYRGDFPLPLRLRGRELTVEAARQVLVADVLEGDGSLLHAGGTYRFAFSTGRAVSVFRSQIHTRDANTVVVLVPPAIRQGGFRRSRRFAPDVELALRARHPRLPHTYLAKTLLDIGGGGFSFAFRPELDVLFPGELLTDLRLVLPSGVVHADAILRAVTSRHGDDAATARLELVDFDNAADRSRWQRTVLASAHPGVDIGDRETLTTVWDVLESSRYVDETTPALRSTLAKSFFISWNKHVDEPELARVLLIHRDERPVATVAANLVYPGTWIVHHLAIDETERKSDRRRLFELAEKAYCGLQLILSSSPAVEHFVAYADAAKGWHQMVIGDFLRRYSHSEDYLFEGTKVYKCSPQELPAPLAAEGLDVIDPTPEHLRDLATHFAATRGPAEIGAYGLAGPDLELRDFSRWCRRHDYERERRILFATEGGRPVAALIAELGSEGVNIFSLLNLCWLVYLDPAAATDVRVKRLLLSHAVCLYRERGKRELVFLGDWRGEPEEVLAPLGFVQVANGFRFVARAVVLPAWMTHVDELMRMMRG